MFKNYIIIAFRNLRKHKGFSFINISGLAIGMACAIFIMLYVDFELSYDNFHDDADRIYRIVNEQTTSNGIRYYAGVTAGMGPAIKNNLSQVENVARIVRSEPKTVKYGTKAYLEEKIVFAEQEFFDIFSIRILKGDLNNILTRPLTAVITQSIAAKYFSSEDPVGKFLDIDGRKFAVTGIIADSPKNSHFKPGIIQSFSTLTLPDNERPPGFLQWNTTHSAKTYFKLVSNTEIDLFQTQINQLAYQNLKEKLAEYGYQHNFFLQNIKDIHLHSHFRGEFETPGNAQYLYIISFIGLFILLIACINFTNLSTARSAKRSAEVGMRKVVGATRKQLIFQIMGESLFISVITLVISFILVVLTIDFFNSILNTNFETIELLRPRIIIFLLIMGIFTGVTSAIYPAFFLSGFRPAIIFKGTFTTGKKGAQARKILVIGQIVISVILIIGILVIYRQIDYMKNYPLGFDKEQKLIIMLPEVDLMTNNYETIKSEFKKHPSILGVTASSSVPGRSTFFWRLWPTGMRDQKSQPLNFINVDYDFIDIYDMEIIAGRSFDRTFGSDLEAPGWVINESAVKAYDWNSPEEAIGKEMMDDRTPIIGVVKDFHFKGLQNAIEPLAISVWSEHFNCFTLEVSLNNLSETISYAEDVIQQFFPEAIFNYFFLDDDFNRQYHFEEQISVLFSVFTFLGIIIAVLGLFGLTAFIAEQRTKEIGIRKVFGASIYGLVFNFWKDFGEWVLIANIIAWPVAYYFMNKWLQNFAYRIDLSVWIFILAGLVVLVIALLTVSFQSIKAAMANPIDSLRYE